MTDRIAYTVSEFAAAAGISRSTAYLEIAGGRLRPVHVGRRTLIPAEEARAWLNRLSDAPCRDGENA